jgi:DNA-binding protein H-NS
MNVSGEFSGWDRENGEDLNPHFEQMTLEDLWNLRENIQLALTNKIGLEKLRLEKRLAQLARNPAGGKARQPYPEVLPKYQNPANPGETWSGRGKQPAWVVAQLKSGKKLDDLAIKKQLALCEGVSPLKAIP